MKLNAIQKKALKASIKHWKDDIVAWLEGGYEIITGAVRDHWCTGERVKTGVSDCPCCFIWYTDGCTGCPLNNSIGGKCKLSDSPYIIFDNNPTLTNARKMVRAMEKILKEG